MGREPLFARIPPLTPVRCRPVVLCGISRCFHLVSPSQRQIVHALLTRSPLSKKINSSTSFDLHVLGTPPAFVLSQDQTLEFNLVLFLSLGRFNCFLAFLSNSFSWNCLACLFVHCIVFKVPCRSRDSFCSILSTLPLCQHLFFRSLKKLCFSGC